MLLLGMLAASVIAFVAYLVGYGAGIATVPHEEPGDAFASEPLRHESIARLTVSVRGCFIPVNGQSSRPPAAIGSARQRMPVGPPSRGADSMVLGEWR